MLSFEGWLQAKLWGVTALSFLFTFAQIPMLLRHGLGGEGLSRSGNQPARGLTLAKVTKVAAGGGFVAL